jgi:hypothetical protein
MAVAFLDMQGKGIKPVVFDGALRGSPIQPEMRLVIVENPHERLQIVARAHADRIVAFVIRENGDIVVGIMI